MNKYKNVHFIGIGGTGLSAIARVLLQSGYVVTGSDQMRSPNTQRLQTEGAKVFIGHDPENITGAELVIRSSAISDENIEVLTANLSGIKVLKRADFLGELLVSRRVIAIAGSHGKTTTTAMVAWLLMSLGRDPSYIIGSESKNLDENAHAGKGNDFVIEADEYDYMFLGLSPHLAVVTNVEHDHPDCFPTKEDFEEAFLNFSKQILPNGFLLICGNDPGALRLLSHANRENLRTLTYGIVEEKNKKLLNKSSEQLDYFAQHLIPNSVGGFSFDMCTNTGEESHRVKIQIPGEHNALNTVAALAVMDLLEIPISDAIEAMVEFRGTERRFEVLGQSLNITIVDDYAHHPTEIRSTLAAARVKYPERRIWALWQPHTYSRTRTLLSDFSKAFNDADHIIVTDIYAARESSPPNGFSSHNVLAALQKEISLPNQTVHYIPGKAKTRDFLLGELKSGDLLIILSAGDANEIGCQVMEALQNQNTALIESR
ncbi:UDP-N-acetylmuramate--L-alanine ligase [Chloroflexota bacterium]